MSSGTISRAASRCPAPWSSSTSAAPDLSLVASRVSETVRTPIASAVNDGASGMPVARRKLAPHAPRVLASGVIARGNAAFGVAERGIERARLVIGGAELEVDPEDARRPGAGFEPGHEIAANALAPIGRRDRE